MLRMLPYAGNSRASRKVMGCAALLLATLCGAGPVGAAAAQQDVAPVFLPVDDSPDGRMARIRVLMGERHLHVAREELDALLREYPDSAAGHRLYAQYHLTDGYQTRQRYSDVSLRAAEALLAQAVALAPDDAAGYVLQGFVFRLAGRHGEARAALERAERLGTDDPWLHLNWGELLLAEKHFDPAAARFRRVLKDRHADAGHHSAANMGLITYFQALKRDDDAERVYLDLIRRNPDSATVHGNYAGFLLCRRDDHDGAILQAKQARELGDYPLAQLTLGAALYRKWSVQVGQDALDQASISLGQAYNVLPPEPVMALQWACGGSGYRAMNEILKAMHVTGAGTRLSPMAAVMLAAEAEPPVESVPGVFALTVENTGRGKGQIYLNSHTDYRDQRNLTIRLSSAAADAFRLAHGSDPDVVLRGKPIEVRGYAKRVEIALTYLGEPTGKHYYQTHVAVDDPEQISFSP